MWGVYDTTFQQLIPSSRSQSWPHFSPRNWPFYSSAGILTTSYLSLILKQEPPNHHGHGLGAYIKSGFHGSRDSKNGDPDLLFIYFRIDLVLNMTFISIAYCWQDGGIVMFGKITSIHIYEWFVQSHQIEKKADTVAYDLSQIVDKHIHIPWHNGPITRISSPHPAVKNAPLSWQISSIFLTINSSMLILRPKWNPPMSHFRKRCFGHQSWLG